jgi:RNA polymerase sigma-70 factor, ECF subfamily
LELLGADLPLRRMTQANVVQASAEDSFRAEALRWLPNVARYARLLTRNQADADDLAQETYLRAFQSWATFRPGSDCRKWLFTICRNLYLNDRRRANRIVGMDDPEAEVGRVSELYWSAVESGLGDLFDRIDVGPALDRGLRAMPSEYREVVVLVDIESYAYADAAKALGIPIGTVRSRLFRARRLLQEVMIECARDMGLGAGRVKVSLGAAEEA